MNRARASIVIRGAVQGVGFRPFVHRVARRLGLAGWVRNEGGRVVIEVEGPDTLVREFLGALETERPPEAVVHGSEVRFLEPREEEGFAIRESASGDGPVEALLPDRTPCGDCVRDLFDPANRRHRYPFTHCASCGPRYSLIESVPWDRERTAMKRFRLCPACEAEYDDPEDRRFHAQTHACPACGPKLALLDHEGRQVAVAAEALARAEAVLRRGGILALKATGGFQLLVDSRDEEAVRRLRERKAREAKPFAVMARDLQAVRDLCRIGAKEEALLVSPAAPIVLLEKGGESGRLARAVAPDNPRLGVMLPSTPLHHLLLDGLEFPVVATSGNRSGEPLCIDDDEAVDRLGGIADAFLTHDRPIVRPVDDSVVQVVAGGSQVLRRARGFAPLPLRLAEALPVPVFAAGAHLKNAVALGSGDRVFLSQHLGDLDTGEARKRHRRTGEDLVELTGIEPGLRVRDAHPDFAAAAGARAVLVQHHVAHVAACMGEHGLRAPVLGIAWDGSGHGTDHTVWGGEFFRVEEGLVKRVAHLRTFPLPGGEAAVREPRRSALGCGFAIRGGDLFEQDGNPFLLPFGEGELRLLRQALERGIHAPATSSAGRLFDAVASLLNLRQVAEFEGQAAMDVEFAARDVEGEPYPFVLGGSGPAVIDWAPLMDAILDDLASGTARGDIAARFHESLVGMAMAVALREGVEDVVVTGGVFQNRRLTEVLVGRLRAGGFRPHWHRQVPPNDGGIAFGQVVAANWTLDESSGVVHGETVTRDR